MRATFYKQCVVQVEKHYCKCYHLCCELMQHDAQSIADTSSILSNNLLPLTTQGVIPETMLWACNTMLLHDKLRGNIACVTRPGWCKRKSGKACSNSSF